jgi:hypothetical protein
VLSKFYELREEFAISFTAKECELAHLLSDETLNTVNKSMQGKNENIITSTDKINSFKEKLTLWGARIKKRTKLKCSS